MKIDWKKQQEIKSTLNALFVSTEMQIYKEALDEINKLWDIEAKAILFFMEDFPIQNDGNYYPQKNLETKVAERLNLTKQLICYS